MGTWTEPQPNRGAGWDYRVDAATHPDDVIRFGRKAEQYPRLYINPADGKIYAGQGTAPPTPIGETYSNAILLATSDAPESWKAQATYVADGTADEDAWNTAAFVAAAAGRNLLVSPGTIRVRSTPCGIFDNIDYQGSGWRGSQRTVLTSEDGYTPTALVKADGVDSNDRVSSWKFHGFALNSDSINGSTKNVNLIELEWASDAEIWHIAFENSSGHAVKALSWWDSEMCSFRIDGVGSRGAANEAAVKASFYFWSDNTNLANCNNVRVHHFTSESTPTNKSDALLYADSGSGSDDNHNSCSVTDFKYEHRSVVNTAGTIIPSILLDGSHNFDVNNFHFFVGTFGSSGSYTPQPTLIMRDNLGTNIGPFSAQGIDTGVGTSSVRAYIKTEGTNTGCFIDKGRVSANTGCVPSVSAVEIGGTYNSQVGSLQWWFDSTGGTAELITGWPIGYTPVIRNAAGGTLANAGAGAVNSGELEYYGVNRVRGEARIKIGAGFSDAGASIMSFSLPKPAKRRGVTATMSSDLVGYGTVNDNSTFGVNTHKVVTAHTASGQADRVVLVLADGGTATGCVGENEPWDIEQDDQIWFHFDYEYDT
jgi:hypothetical protein